MNNEDLAENSFESYAQNISEIFEQDSRRYNRPLTEEQEARAC